VKWADHGGSRPTGVGRRSPRRAHLSAGWRPKGFSWNGESLGKRKNSFRRKKGKWADHGGSRPTGVGRRPPCRALISAGWRSKGFSWNGDVLGEEEE